MVARKATFRKKFSLTEQKSYDTYTTLKFVTVRNKNDQTNVSFRRCVIFEWPHRHAKEHFKQQLKRLCFCITDVKIWEDVLNCANTSQFTRVVGLNTEFRLYSFYCMMTVSLFESPSTPSPIVFENPNVIKCILVLTGNA